MYTMEKSQLEYDADADRTGLTFTLVRILFDNSAVSRL